MLLIGNYFCREEIKIGIYVSADYSYLFGRRVYVASSS